MRRPAESSRTRCVHHPPPPFLASFSSFLPLPFLASLSHCAPIAAHPILSPKDDWTPFSLPNFYLARAKLDDDILMKIDASKSLDAILLPKFISHARNRKMAPLDFLSKPFFARAKLKDGVLEKRRESSKTNCTSLLQNPIFQFSADDTQRRFLSEKILNVMLGEGEGGGNN